MAQRPERIAARIPCRLHPVPRTEEIIATEQIASTMRNAFIGPDPCSARLEECRQ